MAEHCPLTTFLLPETEHAKWRGTPCLQYVEIERWEIVILIVCKCFLDEITSI